MAKIKYLSRVPKADPEGKRPCYYCGDMITPEDTYPTADEMNGVCEDCKFDGPPTNESAGFRILGSEERERLAGFPPGWTAEFSETARAKMLGNAVVPAVAQFIGEMIVEAER